MEFLKDKEEFKQRMEALTSEEKEIVVKVIPDKLLIKELELRLIDMANTINQVKNIFN